MNLCSRQTVSTYTTTVVDNEEESKNQKGLLKTPSKSEVPKDSQWEEIQL